MNILIVSQKCENCKNLLAYIKSKNELTKIVRIHDVNISGVPSGITRVPTLIKNDGNVIIGGDIKLYLEQFLPDEIQSHSSNIGYSIDGDDGSDNMFSIQSYGESLAPRMTKELEEKINMSIDEAMKNMKR